MQKGTGDFLASDIAALQDDLTERRAEFTPLELDEKKMMLNVLQQFN